MEQGFMDPEQQNVLASVFKDMDVYSSDGKKVGKVDFVYMGAVHGHGEGAATTDVVQDRQPGFLGDLAEVFAPSDNVPDELKNRLYYNGFVRVDSDRLFNADRYVMPDQIDAVSGDRVILNTTYDQLIPR